jgi:Nup133 N terminal like
VPVSYAEEQQAIATVQLVRPRPGVFAEAINHLLVICTTTEASRQSPTLVLTLFGPVSSASRGINALLLAMVYACCCWPLRTSVFSHQQPHVRRSSCWGWPAGQERAGRATSMWIWRCSRCRLSLCHLTMSS